MSLPSTSIKRPVAIAMFYIAVALIGIYSFSRIGVDLLPNVNIPHLLVQTTYSNASPEEIEKLITEPLESAAGTVPGIKNVTSVSKEGISVISLDFTWGTNMDFALLSLREKLDNVRFLLPREAGRPTIIRSDPSASPIMTLVLSYKNEILKPDTLTENIFTANISTNELPQRHKVTKLLEEFQSSNLRFVSSSSSAEDMKRLIDLKEAARVIFKRRLEQIDGVAQAVITGGLEREILVEVNPEKLSAYNLTFQQIAASLKAANVNLPAGSIMKGLFRYSLRTIGEFRNTREIEKTILKRNSDGSVIFLSDVGVVKESFKEREGLTRFNGAETIGLLINKEPESNTVNIALQVKEAVNKMQKEYPEFDLQIVSDYSKFIVNAIENVKQEIYYGGILAFLVLFFFLASIRNVLIIGITIPASLVLTVLLMYLFDISFNIISLGGIAVGVGMLLDNSIIVIENVSRYREKGFSIREASLRGSAEVAMPVVAATLTTMAVFLPLIFIKGIAGELFKDQSVAVVFSLAASLITALTLIPMLASRNKPVAQNKILRNKIIGEDNYIFFKYPKEKKITAKIFFWIKFPFVFLIKSIAFIFILIFEKLQKIFKRFFNRFFLNVNKHMEKVIDKYEKLLSWSLNNRKKVLLFTLLLITITAFALVDIKKEFIPEAPEDEFVVELTFPKGTSLEGNAAFTEKMEDAILNINGVSSIVSNIGRVNEFDFLNKEQISVDKTNLLIKLNSYNDFYPVKEKVRKLLESVMGIHPFGKGINHSFKHVESAFTQIVNPSENDIVIKIKSRDIDKAFEKGNSLIEKIEDEKIVGLADLRMGIEKGEPEYRIVIDREKCAAFGMNINDAASQIVNVVRGTEAAAFSDFDKKISINIKTAESERNNIDKILSKEIISGDKKIPVRSLVNYQLTESYNEIWREGQSRTVYIYAGLAGSSIDKIIPKLKTIAASLPGSPGEIISISGVNDEIQSSFSVLYIALIISVILMYMVLAAEFDSFLFPFIIIFSIPLGLIGSILLLYVFGESLSIISIMGLIILVGIADNDAVVKVEFILRKRKEGLPINEAIMQAGKDRFRPIVMNSFTVIFALIPMIIGIGAATQLRISLSIALAGGLLSATFLTLIIIPVLYTYMERFSREKF